MNQPSTSVGIQGVLRTSRGDSVGRLSGCISMQAAEAYMCGALVRDRQPRANTSPRTSSRTDIYLSI
ncbi:hypothetical protein HCBG_08022 [Histoplasma capsulatum G186AR]|uniref:Uncharacterized protein n=1 Tax=Ajellomyces capsulatus (strain G186AR / H82 / ATCC MYA-2454 / RMSCC 2432) TaxID=447093 RepID=C0NX30_AJECG|nr:uncharacterized protein HCBG_08022 [Histoplasma capsulatum G186AR]EEH03896.1 hypothetical protein HCBG_08022 [Histoplasma capsulatum G186AR]